MKFTSQFVAAVAALTLLAGCSGKSTPGETASDASANSPAAQGMPGMSQEGGMMGGHHMGPPTGPAEPEAKGKPENAAATGAAPVQPPAAFLQCRSCHSTEPGVNMIGPSLAGVVGRPAASISGFSYSPALTASGIVWSRDKLDEWLSGPTKMVPGTRMALTVSDEQQRKAIIDYLETLK